jgi:Domain of unknown function (DUF6429)/Uncharacterised protein family (UPF0158)
VNGIPIDWMDLDLAFESSSIDLKAFLDRETGRVIMYSSEFEGYVDKPPAQPLQDWMLETIEEVKQVLSDACNRYVEIPGADTHTDYGDLEHFIPAVTSTRLQNELWRAISGAGAFRRFREVLDDHPTEQKRWYAFKEARQQERINAWLTDVNVAPSNPRQPVAPIAPVEQKKDGDAERQELIEELTLLLLYLCSWEEKNDPGATVHKAWKGFTFATLNALEHRGLIHQSRKARSVSLSDEGIAMARELEARFRP